MPLASVLFYAAAYFSLIVAIAVLVRERHSFVHRVFAAGMLLLAAESALQGISQSVVLPQDVLYWYRRILPISALLPAVWLAFSLTYARADSRAILTRWKTLLPVLAVVPTAFVVLFRHDAFTGEALFAGPARWAFPLGWPGKALQLFELLVSMLILFNLERTIRSSTGRVRWQIKFMALGVGGIFALRLYLASQALLLARVDTGLFAVSSVALLAANLLFTSSLVRGRSLNADVYLSTKAIQNSLTIILAAIYLLAVGALARFARFFSPSGSLPLDAFLVFLSLTALGALLLSNRLRRRLRVFVSSHFRRPLYDYRAVWMDLIRRTTSITDANALSAAVCTMVSESLEVLSVSIWLVDESKHRLSLGGSTSLYGARIRDMERSARSAPGFIAYLQQHAGCIDLSEARMAWPEEIMQAGAEFFRENRMRYAIGLQARGELVGVMTLSDDRVGQDSTLRLEDRLLVEALAAEVASGLLNLKLSEKLRHTKEVETFQTVSTFFVHDLKNLASRLSLTMQNLPGNFDSPEFRADALRLISRSVSEIDDMCSRLSMLRGKIDLKLSSCDLTELLAETLKGFGPNLNAELHQDLQPLPKVRVDATQIHKVLTNLVLNANEAVNGNGVIQVSTVQEGRVVGFSVRDNGCGMTEEFIEKSLFKPFQTTKKKGLGIGLFHSRLIVEAHHGVLEVSSSPGSGTEFRVLLPSG